MFSQLPKDQQKEKENENENENTSYSSYNNCMHIKIGKWMSSSYDFVLFKLSSFRYSLRIRLIYKKNEKNKMR